MKKINYKLEAINVLKDIVKSYPTQLLGVHLELALSDYQEPFWLSDKEIYFALEKYRCEKELDIEIPHSTDINDILKDGMDLTTNLEDEEDGY